MMIILFVMTMLWSQFTHVCCVAADLFSSSYRSVLTISQGMSGMRPVWLEASSCSLIGCCHLIDALIGQKRNHWLCCSNHIKILNCCGFCGLLFILTCLNSERVKGMRVDTHLNIKFWMMFRFHQFWPGLASLWLSQLWRIMMTLGTPPTPEAALT